MLKMGSWIRTEDTGAENLKLVRHMWMLERPLETRKSTYHVAHWLVKACSAVILMSESWLIG